jgi:DNA transformation protein
MPSKPRRNEFVEHVLELLAPLGDVSARRMFGGHGIYRDGLMFALVSGDVLYLKADGESRGEFEDAGSEPFSYMARRRQVILSYWRAPEDALESGDAMQSWARAAFAAALRARAGSRTAKTSKRLRRVMRRRRPDA